MPAMAKTQACGELLRSKLRERQIQVRQHFRINSGRVSIIDNPHLERHGPPHFGRGKRSNGYVVFGTFRKPETGRHHSNDCVSGIVQAQGPADDIGIACKPPLPQAVR